MSKEKGEVKVGDVVKVRARRGSGREAVVIEVGVRFLKVRFSRGEAILAKEEIEDAEY